MPLYYYTSKESLHDIRNKGFIHSSHVPGLPGRNISLENGVYFTDLPPHSSTEKILWNKYGEAADWVHRRDQHVVDAYIQLPKECLNIYYQRMIGGVHFVCPPPSSTTDKVLRNNYNETSYRIHQRNPYVVNRYPPVPRSCLNVYCQRMPGGRKLFMVPTEHGVSLENIPYQWGYRSR